MATLRRNEFMLTPNQREHLTLSGPNPGLQDAASASERWLSSVNSADYNFLTGTDEGA
jgi:hypothetical protein